MTRRTIRESWLLRLALCGALLASAAATAAPLTRSHTFTAGWHLVSVPLEPADPSPTAVFNEVPQPLRLYDYVDGKDIGLDDPSFGTVAPGRVFWLLLRQPVTVSVSGTAASTTAEHRLPLRKGWNGVATPWATRLEWSNTRVSVTSGGLTVPLADAISRGWVEGTLAGYGGDAPTTLTANSGASLPPWTGYKLFSHVDGELVLAPPPPSTTPPRVLVATPAQDGDAITEPTPILGTVEDEDLVEWRLEYAPAGTDDFRLAASGASAVTGATLGTFDPSLLLNGLYAFRLTAEDLSGRTATTTRYVTVKGQLKVGHFSLSFTDLEVPVAGLPIRITRTYDSRDKQRGEFGVGWRMDLSHVRISETGEAGTGWQGTSTGGGFPTFCLPPTRRHMVTVNLPNGQVGQFELVLSPQCQPLAPIDFARVSFRALPGTQGTLVPVGDDEVSVVGSWPGTQELFSIAQATLYDPELYEYTAPDGKTSLVHEDTGLQRLTDRNGNTLTVQRDGIVHSSGKSVRFERDAAGSITRIIDPNGQALRYTYDAAGDLTTVTHREGQTSTYAYNREHTLVSLRDPGGKEPLRNDYDESGRLVSHTDASGRQMVYAHDLAAHHELVTNRLGHSTLYEYDANGNITRTTDPKGGVSTATYDTLGNKLSETGPLGHTVRFEYDARSNKLSETDPLGRTTRYTYNAHRQPLTITDSEGHVTRYAYDNRGNLLSVTDPLGNVTRYTYDSRGLQLTETDSLGGVKRNTYDTFGNLLTVTDALGHVTRYTYDANGHKLSETVSRTQNGRVEELTTRYTYDRDGRPRVTTLPDGTTRSSEWNASGQLAAEVDPLGRRTEYTYDDQGLLVERRFPDGTQERSTWDAEGHRLSFTDRASRTTRFTHDELGRLTRTTYPDDTFVTRTYNAAGHLVAETDELGHTTTYEVDGLGQRLRETDATGASTSFTYGMEENLLSMTEPSGAVTRYTYDANGRQTRIDYADGTAEVLGWDALGRNVSRTDPAGRTTTYAYDALGRLVGVTDALGGQTLYAHDELGNPVSVTDANGHTVRMEYDVRSQRTQRRLPLGQTERWTYDAAGQVHSRTDLLGRTTTFAYDAMGRVVSRTPDPALGQPTVRFRYSPTGQRVEMVDATGTTTYAYDARDRLREKATPFGTLSYAYDAAGHLRSIRSSNAGGTAVDYGYDEAGRLVRVGNPAAGPAGTAYRYDANGNLAEYTLPNGVESRYRYDRLNRLTEQSVEGPGGTLARYTYTLGAAGNRQTVAELSGRTVRYTYDALYRLTGEEVSNAAIAGAVTYGYDAVGNRLSRASSLPGVTSTTSSYDANDRREGTEYDANGNTVAADGATYAYDFENHLMALNGGEATFAYDGDGLRVARTEGGVTLHFLVDTQNPTGHAQVLEEVQGGVVQTVYTYGHLLLYQRRRTAEGFTVSFHGHDGQGSVRFLTDAAGRITDTYDFDAFGVPLRTTGSTPNAYRYTGEQADPSLGMVYLRARYMQPASGRFWTPDPREGDLFEPKSLHRYTYANADPVNLRDPSGEFPRPANIGWGPEVHRYIGEHFEASGVGRVSEKSISLLLERIIPYSGRGRWRPDLVDETSFELYEIKPLGSYGEGFMQVSAYVLVLRALDPHKQDWRHGSTYAPPGAIELAPLVVAFVAPPVLGVILYEVLDIRIYIALVGAYASYNMTVRLTGSVLPSLAFSGAI